MGADLAHDLLPTLKHSGTPRPSGMTTRAALGSTSTSTSTSEVPLRAPRSSNTCWRSHASVARWAQAWGQSCPCPGPPAPGLCVIHIVCTASAVPRLLPACLCLKPHRENTTGLFHENQLLK